MLHSVQIAATGDFLKKMSEVSPPGGLFRIFHFLVAFLLFRHVPPGNKGVSCLKLELYVVGLSGSVVDPEGLSSEDTANSRLALYDSSIN